MKGPLRKGTYADLNLYFLSDFDPLEFRVPNGTTYGVCRYPELGPTPAGFTLDGCIIRQDAMNGTSRNEAKFGYTVVHEVGHWLGLIHVWGLRQGFLPNGLPDDPTCIDDDEITDTTLQRDPTSGCPAPIGSPGPQSKCPGVRGTDNIHNFMDYSDDECLNLFTPEQISIMNRIYDLARRPFRT
jgi:hypothetical protein